MYSPVVLIVFILLRTHHHHPSPEPSSSCKTEILSSSPRPLTTTILLSVPLILTTLGTSYKWSHTVLVFLWLAYFTQRNVLKIHSCVAYVRISSFFKEYPPTPDSCASWFCESPNSLMGNDSPGSHTRGDFCQWPVWASLVVTD